MSKIRLKQIGPFNPVEIIEVEEERVKDLMDTGNYAMIETVGNAEIKQIKKPKNDNTDTVKK